jgi:hypothetical protein
VVARGSWDAREKAQNSQKTAQCGYWILGWALRLAAWLLFDRDLLGYGKE